MANISNYVSGIQNLETLNEKHFNNFADMVCYLFVTERLNIRNGERVSKLLPFVGNFNLDKPTLSELENNNIKAYKKRMLKMFHEHFDKHFDR